MENNGRGIFYGVIGVATLVVAIIGATFAYFSAATGSNNNITAGGASISLGWNEVNTGLKSDLVPVESGLTTGKSLSGSNFDQTTVSGYNAQTAATTFAKSPVIGMSKCKDTNGNNICSMYQFTVKNESTNADQQIYASLTPSEMTAENMYFAIFKGTETDITGTGKDGYAVTGAGKNTKQAQLGELVVPATLLTGTTTVPLTNLNQLLVRQTSETYTVIVWIEEVGTTQKQGGTFYGKINFTTENGGMGVTGVLGA